MKQYFIIFKAIYFLIVVSLPIKVNGLSIYDLINYSNLSYEYFDYEDCFIQSKYCDDSVPLLISLGDGCSVALSIKAFGHRNSAYPFDWIVTNIEKLSLLLENDFAFFLDPIYLKKSEKVAHWVHNDYYDIDFAHDFYLNGNSIGNYMSELFEVSAKYKRRISRFKKLADCKSKLFFIHNNTYNLYPYDINVIKRLKKALIFYFPKLDFELIFFDQKNQLAINEEFSNIRIIQTKQLGFPNKFDELQPDFNKGLRDLGIIPYNKIEGAYVK